MFVKAGRRRHVIVGSTLDGDLEFERSQQRPAVWYAAGQGIERLMLSLRSQILETVQFVI
jgi:hypothetical protein